MLKAVEVRDIIGGRRYALINWNGRWKWNDIGNKKGWQHWKLDYEGDRKARSGGRKK